MTAVDIDRDTKKRRKRETRTLARVISDDPSIFRGVWPGTLLEFGGHWLRSGPITDPAIAEVGYHMSFQVERLATFLSHSWHAHPGKKVLALYAHYNGRAAVIIALMASLIMACLQFEGYLPPLQKDSDPSVIKLMADLDVQNFHMYSAVLLTYAVTYTLCLLFWYQTKRGVIETLRWLGIKKSPRAFTGGAVFLDKLCIHQTDADKKQAGIRAIGSYLTFCDELLVAWDVTYFTRLWCVFELCIFLAVNPNGKIHLLPIDWYSCEVVMCLFCCVGAVIVVAVELSGLVALILDFAPTRLAWGTFFAAMIFLIFPVVVMTMRKMTHTRLEFFREISRFSVGSANCFMESDRGFVVGVIKNLYGDEASFDRYVKYQLKDRISYQLGSNMRIPYLMIVRCLLPFWVLFAVEFAIGLGDLSVSHRWHWFFGQTVCFFIHVPLLITVLEMLCHLSLHCVDWWAGGLVFELGIAISLSAVVACGFGAWAAYIWPLMVSDLELDTSPDLKWKLLPMLVGLAAIVMAYFPTLSHRTQKHMHHFRSRIQTSVFGERNVSTSTDNRTTRPSISMATAAFMGGGDSNTLAREDTVSSLSLSDLPDIREEQSEAGHTRTCARSMQSVPSMPPASEHPWSDVDQPVPSEPSILSEVEAVVNWDPAQSWTRDFVARV